MGVHEQEASRPLFKRWQLVVLCVFLVLACIFAAVAYRNVQQWNKAFRLRRQVEATGGEAQFMQVYGTDFCPLYGIVPKENPGVSAISWPVARLVEIRDRAPAE